MAKDTGGTGSGSKKGAPVRKSFGSGKSRPKKIKESVRDTHPVPSPPKGKK